MDGTDIKARWIKGASMYPVLLTNSGVMSERSGPTSMITGAPMHTYQIGTYALEQIADLSQKAWI
ncbi:MAG: hypothetical protein V8Q27_02685 [Eubacteriales bacterium]